MIDCDELYFCELFEELGDRGVLIYVRLWSLAEDWGGYEPNCFEIAMKCGGLRARIEEVQDVMTKLVNLKKVIPYEVGGRTYHWSVKLMKHQPLDNPSPPRLPLPPWIDCTICKYRSGKKYARYEIASNRLPDGYEDITGSVLVAYREDTGNGVKKGNVTKGKETLSNEKKHIEAYEQCSEYVYLKPSERGKLVEQLGEDGTVRAIEILNNYKGSSGRRYKSDYMAILNWVIDRMRKEGYFKARKLVTDRQRQLKALQEGAGSE